MSKIKKLLESILNETSECDFEDLPKEKQDFIFRHNFNKSNGMYNFKNSTFWRSPIMDVDDKDTLRVTKDELKDLINDEDFRYINIRSIGF